MLRSAFSLSHMVEWYDANKPRPAEERPVCRSCARFRLPCHYDLRLRWHTKTADQTISSSDGFTYTPRRRGTPLHFVHFSTQDFTDTETGRDVFMDAESDDDASSSSRGMLGGGTVSTSPSPSSAYLIVDEPSWFAPLEFSSPLDDILFMYCESLLASSFSLNRTI